MGGHLLMNREELQRKSILELVANKHITLRNAAKRMNLSYRQTLRVYARYRSEGDLGLLHRSRGRPSNRAYPASFRKKVIARYRGRYKEHGLGPTLGFLKANEIMPTVSGERHSVFKREGSSVVGMWSEDAMPL